MLRVICAERMQTELRGQLPHASLACGVESEIGGEPILVERVPRFGGRVDALVDQMLLVLRRSIAGVNTALITFLRQLRAERSEPRRKRRIEVGYVNVSHRGPPLRQGPSAASAR